MANTMRLTSSREEGPESPEALMISALLDSGEFDPERHHLTEEHLVCWQKLWRFGVEHQQVQGNAPPLDLVRLKFPEFTFTPNLGSNRGYHAHELHKAHSSRQLRSRLQEAIRLVNDEEIDEAYTLLEGLQRPRTNRKPAADLWEHVQYEDNEEPHKIRVPWEALGRVTGGIGPAELWYLAGRPGTGKTFSLCAFVAEALKAGQRVRYLSLEMSAAQIHKRVRRQLAAYDVKLLGQLDSHDVKVFKKAVEDLQARIPGSLGVVDPSHGKATNALVREQADQADLVVVDHVGLMYTNDNRKAIDDWRAMASISNLLKEDALSTGVPILGAVQLNRDAENGMKAPKLNQLSQSDALAQDGDVVITMRKLTEHVRLFSAEKNREGAPAQWHTRFDPEKARFDQVTFETALELQGHDDDREVRAS